MSEVTCAREDCDRPAHCKGLCKSHYTQMRRDHPDRPRCSEEGCDRSRYAKGVCQLHRMQDPEQRERHRRASLLWANANKERGAENAQRWITENRERARELRRDAMRRWRERNPERAAQKMREWAAANPDRWAELRKAGSSKRRALKRDTQVEPIDLAKVLADHGMTCHICNTPIPTMTELHFDHVTPLSKGGTHTYDNLKPAHASCNLRKASKVLGPM